jgi:hypothetical protein
MNRRIVLRSSGRSFPVCCPVSWLRGALSLGLIGLLAACQGQVQPSNQPTGSGTGGAATGTGGPTPTGTGGGGLGPAGSGGTGGPTGTGGTGAGTGSGGSGGTLVDNGLPGRTLVRRLSNAEYDATIATLFGDSTSYASAFPGDTIVNGFTNNTDVQDVGPALAEQYLIAAEKISTKATQSVDTFLGCKLSAGDTCINDFITRFGKRAWRRPVNSTEQADLLTVFKAGQSAFDATTGVQLLVQAFLVSPTFLYRPEVGVPVAGKTYAALTSWEIASRLSYFLTGSMPDDKLLAKAETNSLVTADAITTEARRLLALPAARARVAEFFGGWLNLRGVDRLQRDTAQFPKWDSRLPLLFADETRAFVTSVVFDGAGDFKTLMTAPFTYGDPSLAAYYGGKAGTAQNGIARIDLPAGQRAGLLTQASFLATHAKEIQTDPVARGKFVRERLLCQGLQPPPPELNIKAPEITPGTTTRQRFIQHEAEPLCAGCHTLIDPIGLAFENYDAIGQWRDQEQGLAIDASGNLTATDVAGPLNGVVEMAGKLAQSSTAAGCFVRQSFRFAFGRAEGDSEDARIATITGRFKELNGKVQELLVALTVTPDFMYLPGGMK